MKYTDFIRRQKRLLGAYVTNKESEIKAKYNNLINSNYDISVAFTEITARFSLIPQKAKLQKISPDFKEALYRESNYKGFNITKEYNYTELPTKKYFLSKGNLTTTIIAFGDYYAVTQRTYKYA